MTKEFKLEDKKMDGDFDELLFTEPIYWESDVKEFIKRLKERFCYFPDKDGTPADCPNCDGIDKLAGEKLI